MDHIDLIREALRVLFLVSVPLIAVVAVSDTIVSAIMAASGVQERSASYAIRVIAIVCILSLIAQNAVSWIVDLAKMSLQ